MKFLIVLIVLVLYRFVNISGFMKQLNFDAHYFSAIKRWFSGSSEKNSPITAVLLVVLPITTLVAIVGVGLSVFNVFWGWFWSFLVLLYCLMGVSWGEARIGAMAINASSSGAATAGGDTSVIDDTVFQQQVTSIFNQLFVVVFWYFVLGAAGAVIAYILGQLAEQSVKKSQSFYAIAKGVDSVRQVVTWLPGRCLILSFALVGHFASVFAFFCKTLMDVFMPIDDLLDKGAKLALDIVETAKGKANGFSLAQLVSLFDRTMITWLVVAALVTIGGWLS